MKNFLFICEVKPLLTAWVDLDYVILSFLLENPMSVRSTKRNTHYN